MMDAKYELVLDTSSVLNSFVFALTQSVYRALSQKFYFNLHDKGFVIFSKEANCENGTGGVEYAFVKPSTDFFIKNTMYYKMGLS